MVISSKFDSKCKDCGGKINVGDKVEWTPGRQGVSHTDKNICILEEERKSKQIPAVNVIDTKMLPLMNLFTEVSQRAIAADKQGRKFKKVTLHLHDGQQTIFLSITRTGQEPGSIAVTADGEYIGCIRKSGECTNKLRHNVKLQDYLLDIATSKKKMIAAANEYARLTNSCSFCGLELTNDYSIMVAYGPICADKWGLPHYLNGTADRIIPASLPADMKVKLMKMLQEEDE